MVIDGHTHVYPDSVARKAIGASPADLKRFGDGTVGSLTEVMTASGVDRSICLGVANTGDRVENANRFAGSLDPDRFIGFGSVHPDLSPAENVASLRRHGLRGAKVHPMFQNLRLDDGAIPGLDLIACHFGGYQRFEEAAEIVVGLPVHLDTSWPPSVATLAPERVRAVIDKHGAERICFASDWPMADPAAEIAAIRALGLPDDETDAILGGNLARLLRMTEDRSGGFRDQPLT